MVRFSMSTEQSSANPFAAPEAGGDLERPGGEPAFSEPRTAVLTMLVLSAGASLMTAGTLSFQIFAVGQYRSVQGTPDADDVWLLEISDLVNTAGGLIQFSVLVATVVAWGLWVHRAALNLRAFEPDGQFEFSPAAQVWWYFVPLANLFQPFRATREILNRSAAAVNEFDSRDEPLNLWWASWVLSNVVSNVAIRLVPDPSSFSTTDLYFGRLTTASVVSIIEQGLSIAAAVLAFRLIRSINALQCRASEST